MKQLLLSFTILDYFQKLSKELSTILADNGVKVITAESYKSTPELSHAIRYRGRWWGNDNSKPQSQKL